jgi:hypothetical protein
MYSRTSTYVDEARLTVRKDVQGDIEIQYADAGSGLLYLMVSQDEAQELVDLLLKTLNSPSMPEGWE